MTSPAKAVFLDRDGTVIEDRGYLDNVEGVELKPGAGEALALLSAAGFVLVLVTNQSGIGRGYYTKDIVDRQHARLAELLRPYHVVLQDIEVCPHAPEAACDCRKPAPELLLKAARKLNIDISQSFMIGDKESDLEAGRNAGCKGVVALKPINNTDYQAVDIMAAANYISAQQKWGKHQ